MILKVHLDRYSYDIVLKKGCLDKAGDLLNLDRKVLIVTDSGVPEEYARRLARFCKSPTICCIPQGEDHKTLTEYEKLLETMLEHGFGRKDCVVAVGGGICGDLAGFTAASYMRGIDFYNIPTTVLSQVDSSIGGKTAVNLHGIKNVVGAFYQPKKVLIDVDLLKTLPDRQISAGLAEALKMAATFDEDLFQLFEKEPVLYPDHIEEIISKSLRIKARVVEEDEKEQGLRKALNFGHTIGHGIESVSREQGESFDRKQGENLNERQHEALGRRQEAEASLPLYHGECVAIGMLPMCSPEIRTRLLPIYNKLNLPNSCHLDIDQVLEAMLHDKKATDGKITIIETDCIGSFHMRTAGPEELKAKASTIII